MAPRTLPRRRSMLDVSQILARQAAAPTDVGVPIRPPTALLPFFGGGGGDGKPAEFGPAVQTNVANTGNAADYGLTDATRAGPAVGAGGQPLDQQTREPVASMPPSSAPASTAPAVAPVGFGQTANSSTSRPSGQYTTVGDIFAEPTPQSQDPREWWQFHQDRFRKIANHYGMDPREVAGQEATIELQIAAQNATRSKEGQPALTGPEAAKVWEAYEADLVAKYDFAPEQSMQPSRPQDNLLTGTDGGNPLARYGVYTPEQVAGIQAAIGQYVTGVSDKFSAQTGFKADPQTAQAYMMQAQALPAINALEGQQRLAQQVYELEDQVRYYQALQQAGQLVPQQKTEDDTEDDTSAAIVKIMEQLG